MEMKIFLTILLCFSIYGRANEKVENLTVYAVSYIDWSTRRPSTSFVFKTISPESKNEDVELGGFSLRFFIGEDVVGELDAIKRLEAFLLKIERPKAVQDDRIERQYIFSKKTPIKVVRVGKSYTFVWGKHSVTVNDN